MSDRISLGIALAATAVALALIVPDVTDFMLSPDAGSQLSKGFAILHGRHPFIEIDSSVYGPAIFYLSALAQWLDPDHLRAELALIVSGYVLAYGLLYWVLLRQAAPAALFWTFVVICLLTLPAFHKYHVVLAPAIYLFCVQVASSRTSPGSMGAWLGVGSALTGLFRLDFGAYCVLASLVLLWIEFGSGPRGRLWRSMSALFAAGALVAGPWAAYLAVVVGPLESFSRFAETTLGVYQGMAKDLPPFDTSVALARGNRLIVGYWLMKVLPIVVLCGALVACFRSRAGGPPADPARLPVLIAASLAAALFFLQAGHRIDLNHLQQVFAPAALVSIMGIAASWRSRKSLYCALLLIPLLTASTMTAMNARLLQASDPPFSQTARALGSWRSSRDQIIDKASADDAYKGSFAYALRRVRDLTRPDDAVLFLPFAAQSYFFSGRMFETSFGWLNPGRFHQPDAERRFVDSLDETVLIVDNPSFSFDRMPERNMRSYAPHLSAHIYTRYGIFDVAEPLVLLSADPRVLGHHGRYALRLTPITARQPGGTPAPAAGPPVRFPGPIASVNTLPVAGARRSNPQPIPHHGGLLIGTAMDAPAGDWCAVLVPEHGGDRYAVTEPNGTPVPWSDIGTSDLIDTRSATPGRYNLLAVSMPFCSADEDVPTIAAVATGVVLDLQRGAVSAPHASMTNPRAHGSR